jgi:hypothetical protein
MEILAVNDAFSVGQERGGLNPEEILEDLIDILL